MIRGPCDKRDGENLEGALTVDGMARNWKHCTLRGSLFKASNGEILSLKF